MLLRRGYSRPFCGCASLGSKARRLWVPATLSVRVFTYMADGDGCARAHRIELNQCQNERTPLPVDGARSWSQKKRKAGWVLGRPADKPSLTAGLLLTGHG